MKSIPVMQWRLKGNADVGKGCNEGTGVWLVASVRQFESVRFVELVVGLVIESVRYGSVRFGTIRFGSVRGVSGVSTVRDSSGRFESSVLQGELGSTQEELIAVLHIFLNN